MFDVYDDDEDLPPARRDRERGRGRPIRKARRKSSGSKGWVIGLCIGGGVLFMILSIVIIANIGSGSLLREMIAAEEERIGILESMTDQASAETALPRLIQNNTRRADVYRNMVRAERDQEMVSSNAAREFTEQLAAIERRQLEEELRIRASIPEGGRILADARRDETQKLSAAKRAF